MNSAKPELSMCPIGVRTSFFQIVARGINNMRTVAGDEWTKPGSHASRPFDVPDKPAAVLTRDESLPAPTALMRSLVRAAVFGPTAAGPAADFDIAAAKAAGP